jgi:quinol monooxygenase YgiN
MPNYGLTGKFKAHTGHGAELASILVQASHLVSVAKGCYLYLVSQDAADPNCIWVTEVWASKNDHDNSLNLPGVRELITQALPLIDGRPESTTLDVLTGADIDSDQ